MIFYENIFYSLLFIFYLNIFFNLLKQSNFPSNKKNDDQTFFPFCMPFIF